MLSPWFYAVFINDLYMELLRRGCGVSLFGRRVPLLLYADDIALLARNPLELQVFNFSRTWRFVFNHRKSNVVGFGSSRAVKVVAETSWSLGGGLIAAAVSYKYLGIEFKFCSSGRWDEFLKRILAKVIKKSATNPLAWKIRVRGHAASRVVGPSVSSAMCYVSSHP